MTAWLSSMNPTLMNERNYENVHTFSNEINQTKAMKVNSILQENSFPLISVQIKIAQAQQIQIQNYFYVSTDFKLNKCESCIGGGKQNIFENKTPPPNKYINLILHIELQH